MRIVPIIIFGFSVLADPAWSQESTPAWAADFGALDGVAGQVHACVVWDAGSGPELYAAGNFRSAGGKAALNVARWDGAEWSPLGKGLSTGGGGVVFALAVHDDGSGPALYAGGAFERSGTTITENIARWDGREWSSVGSGTNHAVRALKVYAAPGGSPKLYAGGEFTIAGGVPVSRLAAWNGAAWEDVGGGLSEPPVGSFQPPVVRALQVTPFGSVMSLVVGGSFLKAGGLVSHSIARWNGTSWSNFQSGLAGPGVVVEALVSRPAVTGTQTLYVGGRFQTAGGISAPNLAEFRNNNAWDAVKGFASQGPTDRVMALAVDESSGGLAFFASLVLPEPDTTRIVRFTSTGNGMWTTLGTGPDRVVRELLSYDLGSGQRLVAGGDFKQVGGVTAHGIASWNSAQWSALPDDAESFDFQLPAYDDPATITALVVRDDDEETALYAGGFFTHAPGVEALCIARWDGMQWSALGEGLYAPPHDLAIHDDGSGTALYATGGFVQAGSAAVNYIARWNGAQWEPVGTGLADVGYALAVFDDGTGPALYAGGYFSPGGMPGGGVVKWDGQAWSTVGTPDSWLLGEVLDLLVHDDGTGPHLFAAGLFPDESATPPQRNIARLHAGAWEPLGGGIDNVILCLAEHDDGTGAALYAGGSFDHAGGIPADSIARWKDGAWTAANVDFPHGSATVFALLSHDDGTGRALYAGGSFPESSANDSPALTRHLSRYDGATWSAVAGGVTDPVYALKSMDGPDGAQLFVGGEFTGIHEANGSLLARWDGVPVIPSPWTDLGFSLAGASGAPLLVGAGTLDAGSAGGLTLSNAATSALSLLAISLGSSPTSFKCGTLVPVPMISSFVLPTSASGAIALGWSAWPSGLSGLSVHFQYGIQDAGAVCGVSLSNALRAALP